jgi:hypothetical protein
MFITWTVHNTFMINLMSWITGQTSRFFNMNAEPGMELHSRTNCTNLYIYKTCFILAIIFILTKIFKISLKNFGSIIYIFHTATALCKNLSSDISGRFSQL